MSNPELDVSEEPNAPAQQARGLGALARQYFVHDFEGRTHARDVARIALEIARGLLLSRADLLAIVIGATLHDIGKLNVPADVLVAPRRLTRDEWELVRGHPASGDLLVSPHLRDPAVRSVIRWHHERFDGRGYPDGLAGAEIPLPARIVAVADAYAAMVAARPYSAPRPSADAVAEIMDCAGGQFDPACVRKLAEPSLRRRLPAPDLVAPVSRESWSAPRRARRARFRA